DIVRGLVGAEFEDAGRAILTGGRDLDGGHRRKCSKEGAFLAGVGEVGHGIEIIAGGLEFLVGGEVLLGGFGGGEWRRGGDGQYKRTALADNGGKEAERCDSGSLGGGEPAAAQVFGSAVDLAAVAHTEIEQFDDGARRRGISGLRHESGS